MVQHCLTLADLGKPAIESILQHARQLKEERARATPHRLLAGRSVGVLLEKHSTRTRISFEVGIQELGGFAVMLDAQNTQLGRGETLDDTARMFSGYLHAVVYRTSAHARLEALAEASRIPVINGLSDDFHPCQVLADLQTLREHFAQPWSELSVAWVGDGNNMARSWVVAAGLLGFELRIATPEAYALPEADIARWGQGRVKALRDPAEAVAGAQVVTTDVWASMGQEAESARRLSDFGGFCVDAALMGKADPQAIFLHCLPAHRGEEVSAEVIDGARSAVWDEAENRLHAQKALLVYCLQRSSAETRA